MIGTGDPIHFKAFSDATGFTLELLSDTSRQAFSLLGFSSNITGLISVKAMSRAFLTMKAGHRQGSIQGSTLQLGGAIIIDPSQTVIYFFASRKAGDHPAVDDLLAACSISD